MKIVEYVNKYEPPPLGKSTREDFNPEEPGDLGNLKIKDSYNISLGGKNPDRTKFDS